MTQTSEPHQDGTPTLASVETIGCSYTPDAERSAAHNGGRRLRRPRAGREPTTAVWREQAIAEITAREFLVDRLEAETPDLKPAATRIRSYLSTAREAAIDDGLSWRERRSSALRGANIERTWGQIDAAEEALLQVAADHYVVGQLPRLLHRVRRSLGTDDPRRTQLEQIAKRHLPEAVTDADPDVLLTELTRRRSEGGPNEDERAAFVEAIKGCRPSTRLTQGDREAVRAAFHAASCEARRKQTRVRSFRNMLYLCALALSIAAAALALLGFFRPQLVPLCFHPTGQVVCPTAMVAPPPPSPATGQPAAADTTDKLATLDRLARDKAADSWDILLIELIGVIAAAVAAAAAVRDMRGTSNPYGVPLALAVLKLPTGALTAVLGLLLMRGQFVPGLTALDSSAQIIAWAIVFGYAQQVFTRFIDERARGVLQSADEGASRPRSDPVRARSRPAVVA